MTLCVLRDKKLIKEKSSSTFWGEIVGRKREEILYLFTMRDFDGHTLHSHEIRNALCVGGKKERKKAKKEEEIEITQIGHKESLILSKKEDTISHQSKRR